MRRRLALASAAVVAAAALAGLIYWDRDSAPGEHLQSMGRAHIPFGMPGLGYNSVPPTSGPHADPARWGERTREIAESSQVHNLEHGGILIQYNCARLKQGRSCVDLQQKLREVLGRARKEIDPKIVLAPYRRSPRLIAVTAWTWLQFFDEPDAEGILAFAREHVNSAPERVDP